MGFELVPPDWREESLPRRHRDLSLERGQNAKTVNLGKID